MTRARPMMSRAIPTVLVAPCGMNCRLCRAYARGGTACPGCRGDDSVKPKTRVTCRIKTCERRREGKSDYCDSCDTFPCDRLNHLDKRYKTNYGVSMIDNLVLIKEFGIRHFIRNEKERWTCPECAQLLCVHEPQCLFCGRKWR